MLTKNAVGNLINKYKAVLDNCRLLNVLGALALAATLTMPATALAETVGETVDTDPWTSTGDISVSASSEAVYGLKVSSGASDVTLQDEHTIEVTGRSSGYDVSGIYVYPDSCTVTNNGIINVTNTVWGSSSQAEGIYISMFTDNATVNNNGTINVTAQYRDDYTLNKENCKAYGMYVKGADVIINNFGTINVVANDAVGKSCQAFISNGNANVGTWTLKLGETYGTVAGKGTYYVFDIFGMSSNMNFGTAATPGAKFIISGLGDAFVSGTEYKISDMVDPIRISKFSGYIAKVESAYDFLTVELIDTDPANPLWSNQSIKGTLTATKDNSPAQAAANQTVSGMTANLNQLRNIVSNQTRKVGEGLDFGKMKVVGEASSTMYADAGTTLTDASYMPDAPLWKVFAMPYYCQSGANNNDYDGHMYGIAMGATRSVTDAFSLGVHAGFSKGSGDSDMTDSDATAYTLGLHAVYNVNESLFFRGQLSGFLAESELDMLGASDGSTRANADMDATGLYAMVAAGYDILLDAQNVLTPELGISYFYSHMDGFDTHFRDRAGVDQDAFGMKGDSYDVWYADATLRWTGAYDISTGTLKPTLKAGVRQALSDPEVASTMTFGTATATTYADANQTAFICEAGMSWEIDDMTLSATYSGEFGDVEYSHMGMLKLEWAF